MTAVSVRSSYDAALNLLRDRPVVVLTGAGLSTDSGIPDYRGPGAPVRMPMTYQEFVSGAAAQQRYWARSHLGWSRMRGASPNTGHVSLASFDPLLLITQNVDGLHERAGSRRLVALHGRIADVVCLSCRTISSRSSLQTRMAELNPDWVSRFSSVVSRPDGDVELEETAGYVVPACSSCGGVLKPDVVFFGENVPPRRVARCYDAVDALPAVDGVLLVRRYVADGDERLPVRAPGGPRRDPGGHRQPREYPGRRAGDVQGRGGLYGVPGRPRRPRLTGNPHA